MTTVQVHLHTLCWNDRPMLDFFFRHYETWVDRFFILDEGSNDGTREYLEARPDVELGRVERSHPDSWVLSAQRIYNTAWKQSRGEADWVLVTNIDEHLHHPVVPMREYLAGALINGVTVVPALGYQMLTEEFPAPESVLWRDARLGAPWVNMSKVDIFRPDRIDTTEYDVGRHRASFAGEVVFPERDEVLNLHYKYLGLRYAQERHEALSTGLRSVDRARDYGHKYSWDRTTLAADIEDVRQRLVDISQVDHHAVHDEPRWWRDS